MCVIISESGSIWLCSEQVGVEPDVLPLSLSLLHLSLLTGESTIYWGCWRARRGCRRDFPEEDALQTCPARRKNTMLAFHPWVYRIYYYYYFLPLPVMLLLLLLTARDTAVCLSLASFFCCGSDVTVYYTGILGRERRECVNVFLPRGIVNLTFFTRHLLLLQGRIKKIMQTDEEVGKVAQAVPIIIYILFCMIKKMTMVRCLYV